MSPRRMFPVPMEVDRDCWAMIGNVLGYVGIIRNGKVLRRLEHLCLSRFVARVVLGKLADSVALGMGMDIATYDWSRAWAL